MNIVCAVSHQNVRPNLSCIRIDLKITYILYIYIPYDITEKNLNFILIIFVVYDVVV